MKRLIFAILLVPLLSAGQDLPTKDGKVFYEAIDSISNAPKPELFNRSKVWFVNTFKSANAVLQMDDKESGILMGKAFSAFDIGNFMTGPMASNIHYTININVKDGKYRIQVYDIYVSNNSGSATYTAEYLLKYPKMNKKKIRRVDACAEDVIAGFKTSIAKASDKNF